MYIIHNQNNMKLYAIFHKIKTQYIPATYMALIIIMHSHSPLPCNCYKESLSSDKYVQIILLIGNVQYCNL